MRKREVLRKAGASPTKAGVKNSNQVLQDLTLGFLSAMRITRAETWFTSGQIVDELRLDQKRSQSLSRALVELERNGKIERKGLYPALYRGKEE